MKSAIATWGVASLVVGTCMSLALAQEKAPATDTTHAGTFVSAAAGKLVMTDKANKEHSHAIAKDAKFTIDGKPAALDAFKKGMSITVTTDKGGNATAVSHQTAKPAGVKQTSAKAPAKTAPAKAPAKAPAPGSAK